MILTDVQKDILKEVGNIGIGHAATALSQLTGQEVDIALPDLELSNEIEIVKSYPLNGYLINCSINGELTGNLAFVMSPDETFRMVEILCNEKKGSVKILDDMGISALNELVNILCGAYLSSLSNFCDFNLMPNPPIFFSNYKKEDLTKLLGTDKQILEIKTSFNILKENIYSRMWLVLEKKGMEKILKKLE